MRKKTLKRLTTIAVTAALILTFSHQPIKAEKRNSVAHPNTSYQLAFYNRHRYSYRVASALHFAHSKLHDVLLLTPFAKHAQEDSKLYEQVLNFYNKPPKIEPSMELYAPYTAQATWRLFQTIDSVHLLHEMTEDIMSDADIPWNEKEATLKEAYEYYRKTYKDIVLSPAPLDVTMRRTAVMIKPYFSLTRNYYPKNNNFFYAAHWWHPAVYESMMIGGNDAEQDRMIAEMEKLFKSEVIPNPPQRMLLSREGSPRYSRLSPETANVFDNLHMLHGIAYDIFAYDDWTIKQKRAELYRVLDAMSYKPGDEKLVRKFTTPRPNYNPLDYDRSTKNSDGTMTTIMLEMLDEMMPIMIANHGRMNHHNMNHDSTDSQNINQVYQQLKQQLKLKLRPGIQQGEIAGSFMDAMMKIMPNMPFHEGIEAGKINPQMVEAMLQGWRDKYGNLPDIKPISMENEPSATEILSKK